MSESASMEGEEDGGDGPLIWQNAAPSTRSRIWISSYGRSVAISETNGGYPGREGSYYGISSAGTISRPVDSHTTPSSNAQNPTTSTQTPIPPPPSTSPPLDRNHPNAATIPSLSPDRERCDTCFKDHVSVYPCCSSEKDKLTSSSAAATMPSTRTSISGRRRGGTASLSIHGA